MSRAVRHLRALPRTAVLVAWSALVWAALRTAALPFPRDPGGRRRVRTRARLLRVWSRVTLFVVGCRVDLEGTPPKPPFLLVANHLSYVDVLVLWAHVPCRFLAKSEVAGWPLFGELARTADTLFVERENRRDLPRAVAAVRAAFDAGDAVAVFPEGTSTAGREVLPFRPAFFEVAVRTGAPVMHACLGYSTPAGEPPAHLAVCWWGDMTLLGHLYALLGLRGFRARLAFAAEPLFASDRKELARRSHAAVSARFRPVMTAV